jgi:hypothetical protein
VLSPRVNRCRITCRQKSNEQTTFVMDEWEHIP